MHSFCKSFGETALANNENAPIALESSTPLSGQSAAALETVPVPLKKTDPPVLDKNLCLVETALDAVSEAVLIMDAKLALRFLNQKAQAVFGVSLTTDASLSLLETTRSTAIEALAQKALEHNRPIEQDIRLYTANNQQYFHVKAAPFPVKTPAPPHGVVIALSEFTRLHKLERVRQDFAANVSHELRTPIQLIKGFAETLLDSPPKDPVKINRFISIILKNAVAMENLTTDLLTLVSLEEGDNLSLPMKETTLAPLLAEAVSSIEPAAQKKNVALQLDCPPDIKAVLYGALVVQCVVNLLDNAVKHSPPNETVTISVKSANQNLVIAVKDRGNGIPPKHLARVFERFYRVDRSRSKSEGGTGLGLALVRHIALLHKGSAAAESHAGEGSTFTITLPLFPEPKT